MDYEQLERLADWNDFQAEALDKLEKSVGELHKEIKAWQDLNKIQADDIANAKVKYMTQNPKRPPRDEKIEEFLEKVDEGGLMFGRNE